MFILIFGRVKKRPVFSHDSQQRQPRVESVARTQRRVADSDDPVAVQVRDGAAQAAPPTEVDVDVDRRAIEAIAELEKEIATLESKVHEHDDLEDKKLPNFRAI